MIPRYQTGNCPHCHQDIQVPTPVPPRKGITTEECDRCGRKLLAHWIALPDNQSGVAKIVACDLTRLQSLP
ncbi:MAG: hypothetical protein GC161_18495 [Planctomycetaceae bacterium]|nr:hypothetical protein [Planctomycetaceae bacterium]